MLRTKKRASPRPEVFTLIEQSLLPGRALCAHRRARDEDTLSAETVLEELTLLADSAGLEVAGSRLFPHAAPFHPGTLFGPGQVELLKEQIAATGADLLLVDHATTPIQAANLSKALEVEVMDRTALILWIFAQRARTREGKLQVELARLEYQMGRLVRGWTHLERQRGGIGVRGGPGETQIELDRRMIRDRMDRIKDDLGKVKRHRDNQRQGRKQRPLPGIALVGYTNAGKSTLFHRLTEKGVLIADQLFATLDPTVCGLDLPSGQRIVLSDTVGFIRHLPHMLVAAFRATLEEVLEARLLLHVVDISDPEWQRSVDAVEEVLRELGADEIPVLMVANKIDRLPEPVLPEGWVGISALTGEGIEGLLQVVDAHLEEDRRTRPLSLPVADGATIAWIKSRGKVEQEQIEELEWRGIVTLTVEDWGRLERMLRGND